MAERADKPYWSQTYRIGALRIYAWERRERGGKVFVKFTSQHRRGADRREKMVLPGDLTVRDERGRLDKGRLRAVDAAVQQLAAHLTLGQRAEAARLDAALTLSEGFSRALDLSTGKYPVRSRRWEEVDRARRKLERVLGRHREWSSVTPADARRVWRTLAAESKAASAGETATGARQVEVTLDALYSVANWLREEDLIPADAALPPTRWRKKLKEDWERITESHPSRPARPRHTPEEMWRLFGALHSPDVDPRFALAFDLGGEQRLGQVLRCRRSDLELAPVLSLHREAAGGHGCLRVHGSGHKVAAPIVLTGDQRRAVDAALAGYLCDYEALWRAGSLADYPLFPAGRLKRRTAKVVAAPLVLSRDAARKMFRQLEAAAGVESKPGRGWYGVRRVAADLAEDLEKDERVLNSITGHRDSATRRRVYQEHERPEVLQKAAQTRARLRKANSVLVDERPAEITASLSLGTLETVPQPVPQTETAQTLRAGRFL